MTRIVSATILIAVVGAAIWLGPPWATTVVAAAAAALAARELALLGNAIGANVPPMFAAATALSATVAFAHSLAATPVVLSAALIASAALALLATPSPATFLRSAILVMAPLYIGMPLGMLAELRLLGGPETLTWFMAVMAASDSAQYYTGRSLGRHKLAPLISPAKTIEGAVGGLVAAAIAGAALARFGLADASLPAAAALGFALAIAGMIGDLFESLLKRSAGTKDSASLIPGHGGVLDRVDSYLVAAPLFYLYLATFR